MIQRFFKNSKIMLGSNELIDDEVRHIMASRLQRGNQIVLFNGDGNDYHGFLDDIKRNTAVVFIERIIENLLERTNELFIASPIPKGDREHFLIEKLVELGVSCWIPLKTGRSIIHPKDKSFARLNKYVIEASKQCGRSKMMEIGPLTQWREFINQFDGITNRWVAHISENPDVFSVDRSNSQQGIKTVGAVGPEGGFSDIEIEEAISKGWKIANLGKTILRIETAALAMAIKLDN